MSIETVERPIIDDLDSEKKQESKFPFEIEARQISDYQDLFEKANNSELRTNILNGENPEKAFIDYFNKNKRANEIVYELPCTPRMIATARRYSLDFIENRLNLSPNQSSSLETLVGEILLDTEHSVKQKIKNPEFVVRIKIPKFGGYSFEIINQDHTSFDKWLIVEKSEDLIAMYGQTEGGTHAGTMLKKIEVDELKGKAKYIAINNEKGEKEYTSFYFEKK